jgi:membrane-bound metal-dependent hydrolase YbcI (DUF457 family)
MPSPAGHFLGGVAVGCLAGRRASWPLLAVCGLAATLPDVDFLLPIRHRGPTHSLAAAVLVFAAMYAVQRPRWQAAGLIAAAYGTHVLFDWLGADSSSPRGLMALWPLTSRYFISDLDVFNSVDRRYWLDGFWQRNAIALARELAILLPTVAAAWWLRRGKRD